jgi:AcrR family transcriptional regulator
MRTKQRQIDPKTVEDTRERILRAFSARATRSGIRSVVMSELASELRMSATTLYNHFPSKQHLVTALVERWAEDFAASEAAIAERTSSRSPVERMIHWAESWSASVSRYAPAFWEDLRRDHIEASRIFRREIARRKAAGAAELRPHLRSDLHPEVALAILDLILTHASDPRFSDRTGTGRRQAVETAIRIWARGALESPGTLSMLPPDGGPKSKLKRRSTSR